MDKLDSISIYNHNNEYIPLAEIDFFAPPIVPKEGIYGNNKEITDTAKDNTLLRLYIGGVGILGIMVLYKFYEKSL